MAVRQRGSSWQADVTFSSGPNKGRHRGTFSTEKDAKAWELAAYAANLRGEPLPRPDAPKSATGAATAQSRKGAEATLGAGLQAAYNVHWSSKRGAGKNLVNMGQVKSYFGGDKLMSEIDTDAVLAFIEHCKAKGNSEGTINRKISVLSVTLKLALDRGLIEKLPKFHRRKEGKGRVRFLSADEEKALLDLLRSWERHEHADVFAILIDTGFRPSELFRVEARDCDLKARTITLWETKTDYPRTISMTARVRDLIGQRMGQGTPTTKILFPYDKDWMRYPWDRARNHLGYANDPQFVPYICRHTCASRLVQNGVPINVVREWMGHKTIHMTMRYAHLAPNNLKAAADALDGLAGAPKVVAEDEGLKKALELLAKLGLLKDVTPEQVLAASG